MMLAMLLIILAASLNSIWKACNAKPQPMSAAGAHSHALEAYDRVARIAATATARQDVLPRRRGTNKSRKPHDPFRKQTGKSRIRQLILWESLGDEARSSAVMSPEPKETESIGFVCLARKPSPAPRSFWLLAVPPVRKCCACFGLSALFPCVFFKR